jgi:hypothetical protein
MARKTGSVGPMTYIPVGLFLDRISAIVAVLAKRFRRQKILTDPSNHSKEQQSECDTNDM